MFTFVAGSDVLGARLAAAGYGAVTGVLLVLAGAAWLLLAKSEPDKRQAGNPGPSASPSRKLTTPQIPPATRPDKPPQTGPAKRPPDEEPIKVVPPPPPIKGYPLDTLEADHGYLTDSGVFTEDLIEIWIDYKRGNEIDPIRLRPHPHEFELYYDA